ncbi:MAG: asparagine synthase (glutamine-hydrolyzing) [Candidatus Cloacimonetes bacterium]|nr:asparagine synthase (glutamine-hydrolyzing) [Candidatus Cloacimonadota bacterium]
MCGICGLINLNKKRIRKSDLVNFNKSFIHRGPDESGIYINKNIGLAMNRLSIIDLETGSQPMLSKDRNKVIVFNGEIYNFKSIKEKLQEKDYVFKTNSDTEVILNAYEEWGYECVKKFDGMFAFCIFDKKKSILFLARDSFGEKPLYYSRNKNKFIFCSELKAFFNLRDFESKLNMKSLSKYFFYGYVPAPDSFLRNVNKLLPSHYLVFDIKNKRLSVKEYWNISSSETVNLNKKIEKNLENLLAESVQRRLVSDVPLGIFLSGGIDSSLIVALLKLRDPKLKIKTFSIGFKEKAFDESRYSSYVARKFGTDHHMKILSSKEMIKIIDKLNFIVDEPISDPSIIPTYFLSNYTRNFVKVAIGGEGGDELFGGYPKYFMHPIADILSILPRPLLKMISYGVRLLPLNPNNTFFNYKVTRFFKHIKDDYEIRNQSWTSCFDINELKSLLIDFRTDGIFKPKEFWSKKYKGDKYNKLMYLDMRLMMNDMYLHKVDRASMANSLEVRTPFLNKELAELSFKIKFNDKVSFMKTKKITRKIAEKFFDKKFVYRPKKGFGIPLAKWLKEDLKDEVRKMFSEEKIKSQGLFNYNYVKQIIDDHIKGISDYSNKLWSLFVFQNWYDHYFGVNYEKESM